MELPGTVEEQQPLDRPDALSIRTSSADDAGQLPTPYSRNPARILTPLSGVSTPTSEDMRKRKVWVGKISVADATNDAVRMVMSKFGIVENVTLRDVEENKTTTWALVTLSTEMEARAAVGAGALDNGWEIRLYQGSQLRSKDARHVAKQDILHQDTRNRSLHFLKTLRQQRSVNELAAKAEEAMGRYFSWEHEDEELRETPVKLAPRRRRSRNNSYLANLQLAASDTVTQTGMAIGQFLNDTSRHTFELTKAVINRPLQATMGSATSAAGGETEPTSEQEKDDDETELDEHATALMGSLEPILQSCVWYAATVADGNQENVTNDCRQRLLYVGPTEHDICKELSVKRIHRNSHGHGQMITVKTLHAALEEVRSSQSANETAALGAISCVVVTLRADDDFSCIRNLASELQGRATFYWCVEPDAVPDGLKRIVQSCGWELVSPSIGISYAMWTIKSAALNCCEACLQLSKRILQRLLDRHTMAPFKATQMIVATLFLTQPWILQNRSGHSAGESGSLAKFLTNHSSVDEQSKYAAFVPSVLMQHNLLIILQLCCEGGCVDGQNILVKSGMLGSICDFVTKARLETTVLDHFHAGDKEETILLHRQALITVTEAIQGPNVQARDVVMQTALHDTVAAVLVKMSQTRHVLMRNYQEARINNEVPDTPGGRIGRAISTTRSSTSLVDPMQLGSFRAAKEISDQDVYENGGLVARMLAKETSISHIEMLGISQMSQSKSRSNLPTRSNAASSSGADLLKIEHMAGNSKEFEVELLEHVAIEFLRSCISFSRAGDAVFAGTLGEALAGERVYHALLSQWRFHVILGEIEKHKGVAIKSNHHHQFSRPSIHDTDEETVHFHNHVGRSISRRRITMVSYWTFLDELLSLVSQEHRECLEPSSWDNNGMHVLKVNRVEIQRGGQISPYYFMSNDSDETQVHLSKTGRLEHRLEAMRRKEWQNAILGTDEQTGIWDYSTKETTGQRKRNDNLDASARYWLVQLAIARKNRDPDAPPGALQALMMWMTVHLNTMNKTRLFLVLAINLIVVLFTQDRDKISRRRSDGETLNLFHEDKEWAHTVVLYLGVVTLVLSVVSAFVAVKDRRLVLLAEATIQKEEARMLHNGDFRRSEYAWMFTEEDRGLAGRTKLNCFGVVHVVKHMSWQALGLRSSIFCFLQIVLSLEVIYCTLFVVTAVLGFFSGNPLLYCFHMLDICGFSTELKATVSSGKTYFLRVLSLTLASFSVMYIYAALGFWFFPRSFVDESTGYASTTSLYETLFFVFNFGFRSGGGIADVSVPPSAHKYADDYYENWQEIGNTVTLGLLSVIVKTPPPGIESHVGYNVYTFFRLIYDLSFFIIFVLFFSNVILVVMVDGLNDYREAVDDRKREISSHCIICAQHRDAIEAAGVAFVSHARREHNVYMYLDLVATIVGKPLTEYTGAENHIARCVKRGTWDFIPFKSSLCMQHVQASDAHRNEREPVQDGSLMQKIVAEMHNLEQQLAELQRASKMIEDRFDAEKEALEVSDKISSRRHEQLLELISGSFSRSHQTGRSDMTEAERPEEPVSVDQDVLSWLDEQGLTGPFAAALGTLCTTLPDVAMLTQDDVAALSQLKAMEKRRLVVALSALPDSVLGSTT